MFSVFLIIFGLISFAVGIVSLVISIWLYRHRKRAKWGLRPIQVFTIGIFISVLMIHLPLYYSWVNVRGANLMLSPFLIAILQSIRVFIMDVDFEKVLELIKDQKDFLRTGVSFYLTVLYLVAPLMTLSNVLFLFRNIIGEFHYLRHKSRDHYIMSELNEKSIALARSIYRDHKKAVILFTDVFERNEEKDYDLLTQARDIKAICLKKDISHVDIFSKKGNVEIFLIGNDEATNVSQAVRITTQINQKNTKRNIKVFVFSTQPSAPYIIDSIRYDNLMEHTGQYGEDCFKLRRIDEKRQLIWNTVPKMKVFDIADRHEKTLSVMIVGFGNYGMEFFKMLIWYCQFEGYQLQINIFDKQDNLEKLINKACPELLQKNCCSVEGESHYDIKIFSGVDIRSSDLAEILLYDGPDAEKKKIAERLKLTNLAIVSLGDDDINIDSSIYLRSLFDRIKGVNAKKTIDWAEEPVEIYSVVYDDHKCSILYNEESAALGANLLLNHKDVPYHIHFIGGMSSQFDYCNIYNADLEQSAYGHHIGWVDIEERIYNEWLEREDFASLDSHEWYFHYERNDTAAENARKKYEQYEYYRLSSIAKELYQREIKNSPSLWKEAACYEDGGQTCQCSNCIRRKRSEHMRWNAYTRIIGFSYKEKGRADRAMLHDNLCEWDKLSELDQMKD